MKPQHPVKFKGSLLRLERAPTPTQPHRHPHPGGAFTWKYADIGAVRAAADRSVAGAFRRGRTPAARGGSGFWRTKDPVVCVSWLRGPLLWMVLKTHQKETQQFGGALKK